jgi:threonine dehydrogenase-like Zn-dependent dehydrogenase
LAIGHEGVAEVYAVGQAVEKVQPGDRVVVPFQISCGLCPPCIQGRTANCAAHGFAPTYGFGFTDVSWGGFLSDLVRVPYADHMLVPLPSRVQPEAAASASDNICDALRTVHSLRSSYQGADVLVVGGAGPGSIGLYAVGQALALGAGRVLYADTSEDRRAVAAAMGALVLDTVADHLDETFPITVDASADPLGLELALRSTAPDGTCTSTGIYLDSSRPPRFPLLEMYLNNITFVTGRPHVRGSIPLALELIGHSAFDPMAVGAKIVDWDDAPSALVEHDFTKLVFRRS